MELTSAAIDSLLPKLLDLQRVQYRLHKGLKEDICFISHALSMVQDTISHASEMRRQHLQHDISMRELRELSYAMEDTIDSYMILVQHEPAEVPLHPYTKIKSFFARQKARHKISHQINEFRRLLVREVVQCEIRCMMPTGRFSSESSAPVEPPRISALYADASRLVGMDRPREELTSLLRMEEEEDLHAVAIVGAGGMGKTTLAQVVFQAIEKNFECRVWVTVGSQNPNIRRLLVDILHQVEGPSKNAEDPDTSGVERCGERDLIGRIYECLRGKRYLVVLDDLWSTETLEIIKPALPMNSSRSRVITTTRSHAVAESCCKHRNGYIYHILPLSSKDSLMLFQRRTFGPEGDCPADLRDLANKIVEKCSGVPLAIITLSSLLATEQRSMSAWQHIYSSIGSPHGSTGGMREVLLLSYDALPQSLKVCFLYLGVFPKDYPINCDRIIWCWVDEGFISEDKDCNNTLEKKGEGYLTELFNRSMIEPVHDSYDGKPEYFRIHCMMHDLIKSISDQENFVTILENDEEPLPVLQRKIRRFSIRNINKDHDIPELMTKSHIRSLFIFGNAGMNFSIERLTFLRLLRLEGCKDLKNHSINGIANLLLLRHLSIRHTPISVLPENIGKLKFLQTLDLHCDLTRLPAGIRTMAALSCVCIDFGEVKNEDLQLLSELPSLRYLTLSFRAMPTEKLVIRSNGFPVLQKFDLHPPTPDITYLTFQPETMQKLEEMLLTFQELPEEKHDLSIDISQFKCLEKIGIKIIGKGIAASHLDKPVKDAVGKGAPKHPNGPFFNSILLKNLVDNEAMNMKGQGLKLDLMKNYASNEGNKQKLEPGQGSTM